MYELTSKEYPIAAPLFDSLAPYHLAVQVILEGAAPGNVIVDDADHPQAALAWIGHRYFLAGSAAQAGFIQDLAVSFAGNIAARAWEAGRPVIYLFWDAPDWEIQINNNLKGLSPSKFPRQYYQFETLDPTWRSRLPEDFSIRLIDRELLASRNWKNLEKLLVEMCSERPSVEEFLEKSFGVVLLHGDEIAGWCLSEYNCSRGCEIGIETLEPFRKRGFGTLMTYALVEQALSQGITHIGWDCFSDNLPSAATARKAGFRLAKEYEFYFARFPESGKT